MKYYECKEVIVDYNNNLKLLRGTLIKTDEYSWVQRMGSALVEIPVVSEKYKVVEIKGTVEQKLSEKEVEKVSENVQERPTLKSQKKVSSKVVTSAPIEK